MKTTELKIRVPTEMAEAVRTVSGARNQSMNEYVKRAIRTQLIADATNIEAGNLLALIGQATTPLTQAANFAAIHAAATMAFLREWARDRYITAEMPADLAQEKAELLADAALDQALTAFEDPRVRSQFGWIERAIPDDA
ncbi:hypothetical protein [Sulfobacillus harzensis]|uniref:Uncharacterized protein n=1 Tax=Sulfobacillus harzensis TaxID=2729629 RepID=A0A7Y0L6Z2_9FIRM|nr:hypothetical protein [Sulfobacillus harzensis]NMP24464.1 hypothetical protein [Sulfobacillus harzensis]